MQNLKYNILFGFLFLLLIIHFAFSPLNIIMDLPLHGYYEKPKQTAFSLEDYFTRTYQDSTEKSIKYAFGLFPGFTRIHHQLEYSLFDRVFVKDVSRGKNGYIFRYCPGCMTDEEFDEEAIDNYLDNYSKLKDSLKVAGKNIVWIIAPDKNIIYSEYLPQPHPLKIDGFYWSFKNACNRKKVQIIDFNEVAYYEKNKFPFAVSNKGGVHWTQPYAARCFDSLCNYLSVISDISIKNDITYNKTKNPWDPDFDAEQAANLLIPLEKKENFYFAKVLSHSNAKNKKVLLIGDSFCHAWMWNNWMKNAFSPESEFWYYNREANTIDNTFIKTLDHKNVREYTQKFDIFIFLFTAVSVKNLDNGFINDLNK